MKQTKNQLEYTKLQNMNSDGPVHLVNTPAIG